MYSFLSDEINRALERTLNQTAAKIITERTNNSCFSTVSNSSAVNSSTVTNSSAVNSTAVIKELRVRAEQPVCVNIGGENYPLLSGGKKIITSGRQINEMVASACENSIYAYDHCIKKGFIAEKSGVRIGLCGECVCDGGNIITIKNFSGLCIRFPNEMIGCGEQAYKLTQLKGNSSVLIISPPGVGKTTLLRDMIRLISERKRKNLLVIDENREISGGVKKFSLGETTDVLTDCTKNFGFFSAIKALSPDIAAADELVCQSDADGARFAVLSGAAVLCTVHGESFSDVMKKEYLNKIIRDRCFDYFITLRKSGAGFAISELRNKDGNPIET